MSALKENSPVRFTGGAYVGKKGTVERLTPHKAHVYSPELGKSVCVNKTSLAVDNLAATLTGLDISEPAAQSSPAAQPPPPHSPRRTPNKTPPRSPASYQLPGSPAGFSSNSFGDMEIEKIVLRPKFSQPAESNFLTEWLGERVQKYEVPLGRGELSLPPASGSYHGRELELVSAKINKAESKGKFGQRKETYQMMYVAVSGDGLPTINLREELEKIAAFEAQSSTVRKTIARLELLQSAAVRGKILTLRASQFEMIDEPTSLLTGKEMCDGCGFIGDELLFELLGGGDGALKSLREIIDAEGLSVKKNTGGKEGRTLRDISSEIEAARERKMQTTEGDGQKPPAFTAALHHVAVQIRAFGPRIGIVKGMLVRKPGISTIQLPPSMVKVGPSRHVDIDVSDGDWVSLIIKNEHPSSNNTLRAKVLKGESLSTSQRKELAENLKMKDMFKNLWRTLGVPKEVLVAYEKKPPEQATHAWLVGCADPTDALPPGHIFVTGLHSMAVAQKLTRVFITRSPCTKPSDGQLLPLVMERPPNMPLATWEWLLRLPFGAVLFSGLGDGPPLPAQIADGDLDGDLYLTCWDTNMLSHITPRVEQGVKGGGSDGVARERWPALLAADNDPVVTGDGWLDQVQQKMLDSSVFGERALIGKLYNRMDKIASSHELGMDHPDARAFGAAYVQALEREKHGGAIELPEHLQKGFVR